MVIEVEEHLQPVFLSQHHSGPPSQMSILWTPPFLKGPLGEVRGGATG